MLHENSLLMSFEVVRNHVCHRMLPLRQRRLPVAVLCEIRHNALLYGWARREGNKFTPIQIKSDVGGLIKKTFSVVDVIQFRTEWWCRRKVQSVVVE